MGRREHCAALSLPPLTSSFSPSSCKAGNLKLHLFFLPQGSKQGTDAQVVWSWAPLEQWAKVGAFTNAARHWRKDLWGHLGAPCWSTSAHPPQKGHVGIGWFWPRTNSTGQGKKCNEFLPLCTAVGESCWELAKKRNPFNLDHRLNQIKRCRWRCSGYPPWRLHPRQTTSKGLKETWRATLQQCIRKGFKNHTSHQ